METDEQQSYSISELAEVAGVSTRTIRFYVSEGLLPPPAGRGPTARYTDAHLQQLELINQYKEQYLPLKEIRRRLIGHSHGAMPMSAPADISMPDEMEPELFLRHRSVPPPIHEPRSERHSRSAMEMAVPIMQDSADLYEYDADRHTEPAPTAQQTWRRVSITDDAELLITDDQYRRNQGKIDWLVQWAKRVLEP